MYRIFTSFTIHFKLGVFTFAHILANWLRIIDYIKIEICWSNMSLKYTCTCTTVIEEFISILLRVHWLYLTEKRLGLLEYTEAVKKIFSLHSLEEVRKKYKKKIKYSVIMSARKLDYFVLLFAPTAKTVLDEINTA